MSEDCLYLNIFVSAESFMRHRNTIEPKKPILVFIHGGSFTKGSTLEFDPSVTLHFSDIIYVSIQYRLGPFGFMFINGTDVSGNQALLDQNLALKWVILNFKIFKHLFNIMRAE